MIITRTPLRISFVGGGTDLSSFYSRDFGKVVSTAIDKYIYVVVKRQVGIVQHKYRVNWSKVEFCDSIDEINHPIVRESLRLLNIDFPIEVTTFSDIPAGTGLGSSSAFAVGLLNALYALTGKMVTKYDLASTAAKIEIDILNRSMGKQDHFASAYGNLNCYTFYKDGGVKVEPLPYSKSVFEDLQSHSSLFFIGGSRDASEILTEQNKGKPDTINTLNLIRDEVDPMIKALLDRKRFSDIGHILNKTWNFKKSLNEMISDSIIDKYYEIAIKKGALGAKILGAGGTGFLYVFSDPKKINILKSALKDLYYLPVKFDTSGTRITYYDQQGYDPK